MMNVFGHSFIFLYLVLNTVQYCVLEHHRVFLFPDDRPSFMLIHNYKRNIVLQTLFESLGSLIPKYLNSATYHKDLLSVVVLCLCPTRYCLVFRFKWFHFQVLRIVLFCNLILV